MPSIFLYYLLHPISKIHLRWNCYDETKHRKIILSRNTLKLKISRLNYSIWELHALFQRWDLQSQLQFSTAERKRNRRLNGNSAEINSVEKHRFRVIYQSWTNISVIKCRVPVAFRFDFRSELMLIYQSSKYCHSNSFSLKTNEESQYMFYRALHLLHMSSWRNLPYITSWVLIYLKNLGNNLIKESFPYTIRIQSV